MTRPPGERPDTHAMLVVHRVFRRESRLLPDLVGSTPAGDIGRARELAAFIRDYATSLDHHHRGEDELLWPPLLARVDLEAEPVLRMEAQHAAIAATLARIEGLLMPWECSATASARDRLVEALAEHSRILAEHLAEEESQVLPLVEENLTVPEWEALGARFAAETPKDKLLFFLGALLEEADPAERAELLRRLPVPARLVWWLAGRRRYERRVRARRAPLSDRRTTA